MWYDLFYSPVLRLCDSSFKVRRKNLVSKTLGVPTSFLRKVWMGVVQGAVYTCGELVALGFMKIINFLKHEAICYFG